MKKLLICSIPMAMVALAGCNKAMRIFDSEISAIDRQTKELREQNKKLERIVIALEKIAEAKGETK